MRFRMALTFFGLILLGCMTVGLAAESNMKANLNFFLGKKALNSDWKDSEDGDLTPQNELGLMLDIAPKAWPFYLALDYFSSSKSIDAVDPTVGAYEVEGKTTEFAIGLRKYFMDESQIKPFLGGGLAKIKAEQIISIWGGDFGYEDDEIGLWACAGFLTNPFPNINVGVLVRYSNAEVKFSDGTESETIQAGGYHYGLFAGFKF